MMTKGEILITSILDILGRQPSLLYASQMIEISEYYSPYLHTVVQEIGFYTINGNLVIALTYLVTVSNFGLSKTCHSTGESNTVYNI